MLDLEEALRDWGNTQADLVGRARPVALGFHTTHPRSPGRGCYAVIDVTGGGTMTADGSVVWAQVTVSFHAVTDKDVARAAALAFASALPRINMGHPTVGGVRLVAAAGTTPPSYEDTGEEPVYRVDTEIHASAAL